MNMNPMDFLKNFQNIQNKMSETQEKLKDIDVIGTAGGDMVRIKMNGKLEVISVEIEKEVVDPEDVEMLQDLILAAFTDALNKVKERIRNEVSNMTGGMNFPPGFMGM